jgi:hypothetical protein
MKNPTKFKPDKLKGKDYFGDICIYSRIIIKWVSKA